MTKQEVLANLNKPVTVWNSSTLIYEEAILVEYRADEALCKVKLSTGKFRFLTLNNLHLGSPEELQVDITPPDSVETVELPASFDMPDPSEDDYGYGYERDLGYEEGQVEETEVDDD